MAMSSVFTRDYKVFLLQALEMSFRLGIARAYRLFDWFINFFYLVYNDSYLGQREGDLFAL